MMRKITSTLILVLSVSMAFGQTYSSKKNIKERKDDFAITINENEKNTIDWKILTDHFDDRNPKDTIQFSVKVMAANNNNWSSEKKYTVKGLVANFDELLKRMKKLVEK